MHLVNGVEIYKFKAKNFEINAALLCLYRYVFNSLVNCDSIGVDDISDIHKYLMKKRNINQWLYLLKRCLLNY